MGTVAPTSLPAGFTNGPTHMPTFQPSVAHADKDADGRAYSDPNEGADGHTNGHADEEPNGIADEEPDEDANVCANAHSSNVGANNVAHQRDRRGIWGAQDRRL